MNRKKKVRRAFILAGCVYVIINIFIFGCMTVYMNTNNIASSDKLTMAEVSEQDSETNFRILGRSFTVRKDKTAENIAETAAYVAMPYKFRACAELVIKLGDFIKNYEAS